MIGYTDVTFGEPIGTYNTRTVRINPPTNCKTCGAMRCTFCNPPDRHVVYNNIVCTTHEDLSDKKLEAERINAELEFLLAQKKFFEGGDSWVPHVLGAIAIVVLGVVVVAICLMMD